MPISDYERVTVRLPKTDVADLAERVDAGEYPNRSEAIRQAVSGLLDDADTDGQRRRRPQRALADGGREESDSGDTESVGASDDTDETIPLQVVTGLRALDAQDRQERESA